MSDVGLSTLWENQDPPRKEILKQHYWEWVEHREITKPNQGKLTTEFHLHKQTRFLEPYLDIIQVPQDRMLFIHFRFGTLPVGEVTVKWHSSTPNTSNCPSCKAPVESVAHVMFACPAYVQPRSKNGPQINFCLWSGQVFKTYVGHQKKGPNKRITVICRMASTLSCSRGHWFPLFVIHTHFIAHNHFANLFGEG